MSNGEELSLLPCPFCGREPHVSYPDSPSHMMEIGCPDNWYGGKSGVCNAGPAVDGMTYAETAALWNRRSSPSAAPSGELGEPVKAFSETFSAVTAMKQEFAPSAVEAAEVVPDGWKSRVWLADLGQWANWSFADRPLAPIYPKLRIEDVPLYASPPPAVRAEAAEAQLAHAREVLEQVLSVEQCPHPIGELVNDPDPSAKKCWESGACGCVYGAGFARLKGLGR